MNARMVSASNLPHELLLTTIQTTKLRNAIESNMSTDIKLPKAQISKIIQSSGFLGKLLGPLLKTGLTLIKNVIKPLAKSVLIPLGLTAAASAADAGIHKKIRDSTTTTLLLSNEEMNDIMKMVQALQDSNILLKGVTKKTKNETKEQKGGCMLLGTLGASLLGNLSTGKGVVRTDEGTIRVGYGTSIKKQALILPKTKEYCENESRFNGVYYRDNLPKTIKNRAYIINLLFFSIIICVQKRKKKTKNTYNKAPTTMFYVVGGKEKVKNII